MQLPEVNNTKEEAEKEKFWPRHLLLFPTTSKPMKLSWKIWSTFNSRVRSTKTTMVKRNSDLFLLLFFPKQSQSEEEEEAEEKLLWMEFTAEDHLQPFAMPVGVEWTVKLSRLKNPFFGTWWDNRTNLVKWFFFSSIGISNVTSVVTTASASALWE